MLFREFGILNSATLENSFLYKKNIEIEYESSEEESLSLDESLGS